MVTLNRPGADRPGSVGRPLRHARVRVDEHGEIHVAGALCEGYVGEAGPAPAEWATGDLGHLDADGYLHVSGRRRDVFVTAWGRNVSPEWVESELLAEPALLQAWVYGEAAPCNAALLFPRPGTGEAAVAVAVARANARLPDYARVHRHALLAAPLGVAAGHLTANGRLRRDALLRDLGDRMHALLEESAA